MKFNIRKTKVSIDHVTATSDDLRPISFDFGIFKPRYKHRGKRPTTKKNTRHKKPTYKSFFEFQHKKTQNKVQVFTDRLDTEDDKTYYLPNITVKFFSSWDHPITYGEVVWVLNRLIGEHDVVFDLSQFHVAIDLFSDLDDYYLDRLAGCTKSGRKIVSRQTFPGTYYFHLKDNPFRLVLYDKRQQLLKEKKNVLSAQSLKELSNSNVVRCEARLANTTLNLVASIAELATTDFSWLYPKYLQFLRPQKTRLATHGLTPRDYRKLSLAALRHLLKTEHGVHNNFFYYLRDNRQLSKKVLRALKNYRWCANPFLHPVQKPRLRIRPQRVEFIKH